MKKEEIWVEVERTRRLPSIIGRLLRKDKDGNMILADGRTKENLEYGLVFIKNTSIERVFLRHFV